MAAPGSEEVLSLVERLHEQTMKTLQQLSSTLHTKVDKLVRQVDDVVEQQKKINKAMAAMAKGKGVHPIQATNGEARQETQPVPVVFEAPNPGPLPVTMAPPSVGFNHWTKDLLLVGDERWECLNQVEDIRSDIKSWEQRFGLKLSCKPDETLSRLYDPKRGKLLFALPARTSKVAISVGEEDLRDKALLTLDIASLEEVRKENRPMLTTKAEAMKAMVDYLLKANKTVVIVLPPERDTRTEIIKQWEEIVLEELAPLKSSKFKIINLPKEMRATMSSFDSPDDYIGTWFSKGKKSTDKPNLSPYGARRLLDMLQKSFISRVPENLSAGCPRCTRVHSGGEESCKSKDKLCRRCNRVGHFKEIHDVKDRPFQDEILRTLGGQIEFNGELRSLVEQTATVNNTDEPPIKKKRAAMVMPGPVNPNMEPLGKKKLASFDAWYN